MPNEIGLHTAGLSGSVRFTVEIPQTLALKESEFNEKPEFTNNRKYFRRPILPESVNKYFIL